MKIRSITAILILGVMISWSGVAADMLEHDAVLAELVSAAYEGNNEIKAMEESVKGLQSRSDYEGALADPQIGFALANVPVDSWNFNDEPMTQKQFFVAQTFPWPGKRDLKSTTVGFDAEILELKLKARKLAIARTLAAYYYDLGITARRLDINSEISRMIEKLIPVARARYASGKGMRQDILMARIELDKLTSEQLDLQSRYRQTENKINGLLNREGYVAIPAPKVPAFFGEIEDIKSLVDRALAQNPDLAALSLEMTQSDTRKSLSEKEEYPDVTVKLSYGQRDKDPMDNSRSDFVSLGASFPIPLWKHQRQDKDLEYREALLRSATYRLRDLAARLPQEVARLAVDLNTTAKRYDIYKTSLIPSAQDIAESARADYEVGSTEFNAMITARVNALAMELAADTLLFDQAKKRAELDELLGNLLDTHEGKDDDTNTPN